MIKIIAAYLIPFAIFVFIVASIGFPFWEHFSCIVFGYLVRDFFDRLNIANIKITVKNG